MGYFLSCGKSGILYTCRGLLAASLAATEEASRPIVSAIVGDMCSSEIARTAAKTIPP
eukprot:CAMPEP_0180125094 /NCGR_PEP_ID=MMETSP0986-20121125/5003_1 /TAXON_ID=697907 /ORGANISM="non described non described, Strain CCMP2293" /LENGTH=57 /DNA_ID=CAMNT_0022064481 /DNA_START=189 /DNA_END=359 /DNA_ORIENTATION=+